MHWQGKYWRGLVDKSPIVWKGDLDDDCTAIWNGLMLRTEWEDDDDWWWAVHHISSCKQLRSSTDLYAEKTKTGEAARNAAVRFALKHLGFPAT